MAGLDGSIQGQFALDVQGLDRLKHSAARDPQKQLRSAAEQAKQIRVPQAAMTGGTIPELPNALTRVVTT